MNTSLPYLAGYTDGDGCFFIGKNISPIKYRSALIIVSTNKEILRALRSDFGGACFFGKPIRKYSSRAPINRWTIGGEKGLALTQRLIPFLREKRGDAERFIEFVKTSDKAKKSSLIARSKECRQNDDLITLPLIESFKSVKKSRDPTPKDFAYLAGFIDAECCLTISRYKPNNRPNPTYKILLQCNNTKSPVIKWILENFGGTVYFVPRKSKNPKHKDQIAWRLSSRALLAILPHLIPYLHKKKPVADLLLQFSETIQENGDRHSNSFNSSYAEVMKIRDGIIDQVHHFNLKGPYSV